MTKNHMKAIASPKGWNILRKRHVFVTRMNPGPHSSRLSVPLSVFMRDMIGLASTIKEVKYILNNKNVTVNGVQRKDHRFPVGRFDIISFKETKNNYQILLNEKGKLIAKEVKRSYKPMKIKSKRKVKGNKVQLNFLDGTNILIDKDTYSCGDSLVIEEGKIKDHLPLKKGCVIYFTGGKYVGKTGILEDSKDEKIIYKDEKGEKVETLRKYAIVIGKDKPIIELK